ncbi:MAG: ATP-binding cassette domain-containing protein, partial [Rhizobium sp.]|nr:ATP-binding cassette domain-containing protein [Rhizobium sp.]
MTFPDAETASPTTSSAVSSPSRRPLVVMDQVTKVFSSGTVALSDMSLAVNGGEFVSLLGPSGCGKSTALRIIAGLGDVSSGTIDW